MGATGQKRRDGKAPGAWSEESTAENQQRGPEDKGREGRGAQEGLLKKQTDHGVSAPFPIHNRIREDSRMWPLGERPGQAAHHSGVAQGPQPEGMRAAEWQLSTRVRHLELTLRTCFCWTLKRNKSAVSGKGFWGPGPPQDCFCGCTSPSQLLLRRGQASCGRTA